MQSVVAHLSSSSRSREVFGVGSSSAILRASFDIMTMMVTIHVAVAVAVCQMGRVASDRTTCNVVHCYLYVSS